MLIKLQKQIPGMVWGRAVPSWSPCSFSGWPMTANLETAPMQLVLRLTFPSYFSEQVKELLGLQRMAGKVGMPTSAVALLLRVEVPTG